MITASEQLAEAERIQRFLVQSRPRVDLKICGSLAVWYYCQGRSDLLERTNRVPRDIDFIYSAGGGAVVLQALKAAGYQCDMRLALESQGSRIRAKRGTQNVDAFADPVVLRQTLHFGDRLKACSPCIPLSDLLLLKLQLRILDSRDYIDVFALLISSHGETRRCSSLDAQRIHEIVGHKWTWWKGVGGSLHDMERIQRSIALSAKDAYAVSAQISILREILNKGGLTLKWQLERAADPLLPDGNEVDET